MAVSIEYILGIGAMLLMLSLLAGMVSGRTGVPALILFLLVGMIAGSEGLGGIQFDDPWQARLLGVVALAFILFAGGIGTHWKDIRPILWNGISLSTLGVLLSTFLVGGFVTLFGFSWLEGLLLGAIVSSTDAAAVFTVLRSRNVHLKDHLKPLLELESGSNDPMAVFLTVGLIGLIQHPELSAFSLVPRFILQMLVGASCGYLFGRGMVYFINWGRLDHEGQYPVFSITMVLLIYSATSLLGGNGFLAVYITGLILGSEDFIYKKSMIRFHDSLAWLMQIVMFLALGLLVFPNGLINVIPVGLLVAAFLVFIARPLSVFLSLHFSGMSTGEKTFVSWVGLRGAVPIVLATFPLVAGLPKAELIFNLVFFIVITSVMLQGTTIPLAARWLGLNLPASRKKPIYPIELVSTGKFKKDLVEITVTDDSPLLGRSVGNMGLPQEVLVVLFCRDDEFLIPKGNTIFEEGDTLLVLTGHEDLEAVCGIVKTCRLPEL